MRTGTAFIMASILACSGGPQPEDARAPERAQGAAPDEPVDEERRLALPESCERLEDEILLVAPTRATLRERFGAPDSLTGTAQPNRHVEGVTDSLFTVHYPGMVVDVHMPGGGSDMPVRVDIAHNRYLAFPRIGIGAAGDSVVAALGPPTHDEADALIYDCGLGAEQPVRFDLVENRVARIVINYYVD